MNINYLEKSGDYLNTLEDLANKLYEDHLKSTAENFSDNELRKRFYKYILDTHKRSMDKYADRPEFIKFLLVQWYEGEVRRWGHLSNSSKYARFTPDEHLSEILKHSKAVYCSAIDAAQGNVIDSSVVDANEQHIALIREHLDKVLEVNDERARIQLSEALVDANYAAGHWKFTSFRLREWIDTHMRYSYDQE